VTGCVTRTGEVPFPVQKEFVEKDGQPYCVRRIPMEVSMDDALDSGRTRRWSFPLGKNCAWG
jgi:hypothetical protein